MIIISDLHLDARLGSIRTMDLISEKMPRIIDACNAEDKVIFMGDYFNPANPDNGEREKLSGIIYHITAPKIFLIGNHDKDKKGNHCLSAIRPFISDNNGIIVEDYYELGDFCYISYTLDFAHIESIIQTTKCKYIVGHFSFEYENRGRIFKGELEYKPEYDNKIFILAHVHKSQQPRPNVFIIGAMAPHRLDELGYKYRILIIGKDNSFNFKPINYNLSEITVSDISQLAGANENTKVIFQVDTIEEKQKLLEQLKDKHFLDLKIEVKNKTIDISNLKIENMVKEYLKILGREDLFETVLSWIDKKEIENL